MADGAEALSVVAVKLFDLYRAAIWDHFRRFLLTCCWCFIIAMRTVLIIVLLPLIFVEFLFMTIVWMLRCLIAMADTILARVA